MARSKLLPELRKAETEIIFKVTAKTGPFKYTSFLLNVPLADCLNGVAFKNVKQRLTDLLGDDYDYDKATFLYQGYWPFKNVHLNDDRDVINVLKTDSFHLLYGRTPCLKIRVELSKKQNILESVWANIKNWRFQRLHTENNAEEQCTSKNVTEPMAEKDLNQTLERESISQWSLAEELPENQIQMSKLNDAASVGSLPYSVDGIQEESNNVKPPDATTSIILQENAVGIETPEKSNEQDALSESSHSSVETNTNMQPEIANMSNTLEFEPQGAGCDNFKAMRFLRSMGFTDEGGWLSRLVEVKRGDVTAVLKTLSADYTYPEDIASD